MLTAFAPPAGRRSLLVRLGCGASLVVALLVGASGCGGPKEAANSVSGKVTLGSDPVAGTVTFVGADNKEYPTPLKPDGTYTLDNPPIGQAKVLVKGMGAGLIGGGAPPPKDAPPMPGAGKGVAPPAKYGAVATTDLTYEVKAGKQTYNIELKP